MEEIRVASGDDTSSNKSQKKKKKWFIFIMLLFLASVILFTLFQLGYFRRDPLADAGIVIGAGVKEGTLGPDEAVEGESNGKKAMSIALNGRPVFVNGESEGDLNIVNPENNMLYMKVVLTLKDTGEEVYDSGAIPPGHYVDNDKLTKVLKKGEYNATALVTLFDPDDVSAEYNSANFDLVIKIEN